MLLINKSIVCNIIKKATTIDIAQDILPEEDNSNLSDVEWKQAMAEYQDDESYSELKNLIDDLEPDQQQDIIALMYVGRGDFEKSEWKAALKQARTIPAGNCADYLISKKMMPDYLSEGLARFDFSCSEIEE
jgi:Protein of unknown function (DUF3775)